MPIIRPSRDDDTPAIAAIYAHHVLSGTGSFEIEPPCAADMAIRRSDVLERGLPHLVAEVCLLRSCGWKLGQWLDIVMMERSLGLGDLAPPPSVPQ